MRRANWWVKVRGERLKRKEAFSRISFDGPSGPPITKVWVRSEVRKDENCSLVKSFPFTSRREYFSFFKESSLGNTHSIFASIVKRFSYSARAAINQDSLCFPGENI